MPSDRARYALTGSDELESALTRARARWPEDADHPTRLILRLIRAGDEAVRQERVVSLAQRRAVIRELSGRFTGMYPPDHLEMLRADSPG